MADGAFFRHMRCDSPLRYFPLAVGLSLLLVPVAGLFHVTGRLDLGGVFYLGAHPQLSMLLCGLVGLALVPLTFHLALLLGRFQIWLARHLLVRA